MLRKVAQSKLSNWPTPVQHGRFTLADFQHSVEKVRLAGVQVFTGPFHCQLGSDSKTNIGGYQAALGLSTAALKSVMSIFLTVSHILKFGKGGNLLKASASHVLSGRKNFEKRSSQVDVNRKSSEAQQHGLAGIARDEQNTVAHGATWVALRQDIQSHCYSLRRSNMSSFIENCASVFYALGVRDD